VSKARPPEKKPIQQPVIYLLEEASGKKNFNPPDLSSFHLSDPTAMALISKHLDHVEPLLTRLNGNMLALIEMQSTVGTTTQDFYDWLCRVLVWVTRWFRWYGEFINNNSWRVRFWLSEMKDSKKFVFRPQWRDRWDKFLQCRGNLDCLYPAASPSPSPGSHGSSGGGTQSFNNPADSGFAAGGSGTISTSDPNAKNDTAPFDFSDCSLYVDCLDEEPIAFTVPINGTYYHSNFTTPAAQDDHADPENNVPFIALAASGKSSVSKYGPAVRAENIKLVKETHIASKKELAAAEKKRKENEYNNMQPEDFDKLPAKEMEHRLVVEVTAANTEIRSNIVDELMDTPRRTEVEDAESDGLGEAKHLLAGLPLDVKLDLPDFMRNEEDGGFSDGTSSGFDEIRAVSHNSDADGHEEKIRV